MTKEILKYLLLFLILVVAQVIVFNHLCLFNVAVPLVFIYFIIKLPVNLPVNWALTFSFLIGLTVDIFSNTQGMNALACTILAAVRIPVLRLYFPREDDMTNPEPSLRTLGPGVYLGYPEPMRILASTLLTFIILLAFDSLTAKSR